jgi:hypothetical protein
VLTKRSPSLEDDMKDTDIPDGQNVVKSLTMLMQSPTGIVLYVPILQHQLGRHRSMLYVLTSKTPQVYLCRNSSGQSSREAEYLKRRTVDLSMTAKS